eukprot:m.212135 g.212135  ORF g.212135 m.212135 type:complete len:821 (-) comp10141_c0_seq2:110-2572(-)
MRLMPRPCQSRSSFCATSSTSRGSFAGPAPKLRTAVIEEQSSKANRLLEGLIKQHSLTSTRSMGSSRAALAAPHLCVLAALVMLQSARCAFVAVGAAVFTSAPTTFTQICWSCSFTGSQSPAICPFSTPVSVSGLMTATLDVPVLSTSTAILSDVIECSVKFCVSDGTCVTLSAPPNAYGEYFPGFPAPLQSAAYPSGPGSAPAFALDLAITPVPTGQACGSEAACVTGFCYDGLCEQMQCTITTVGSPITLVIDCNLFYGGDCSPGEAYCTYPTTPARLPPNASVVCGVDGLWATPLPGCPCLNQTVPVLNGTAPCGSAVGYTVSGQKCYPSCPAGPASTGYVCDNGVLFALASSPECPCPPFSYRLGTLVAACATTPSRQSCLPKCTTGVQPDGILTCVNGAWQGLPTCPCPPLNITGRESPLPDIKCESAGDGSICVPQCGPGLLPVGYLTCSQGNWSGSPTCISSSSAHTTILWYYYVPAVIAAGIITLIVIILIRRRYATLREVLSERLLQSEQEIQRFKSLWLIDEASLELGEVIGQGSFGIVHRARWRDMSVAVKTFPGAWLTAEEKWEELDREATILQAVRHPHIVQFIGVGTLPCGTPFIVTELMEVGSRTSVFQRDLIDWDCRVRLAYEIALGMALVHSLGRMHRDLKSSNVLLIRSTDGLHAKIADFGTATLTRIADGRTSTAAVRERIVSRTSSAQSATQQYTRGVGTVPWMAPEVLSKGRYDGAADVYSFGVVMWEIAAESEPWRDLNAPPGEAWDMFLLKCLLAHTRPPVDAAWPSIYIDVMRMCWATNSSERPTFREAADRLNRA